MAPAGRTGTIWREASYGMRKSECGREFMLYSELQCKDVINIRDCRKLGRVCNLGFDECKGCICKIMVPGSCKLFSFLKCDPEISICWKDIRQIGPDIILVDID